MIMEILTIRTGATVSMDTVFPFRKTVFAAPIIGFCTNIVGKHVTTAGYTTVK